jgi:murein DD-endopeptidase MepM/ murein hydrolase activator NlpD
MLRTKLTVFAMTGLAVCAIFIACSGLIERPTQSTAVSEQNKGPGDDSLSGGKNTSGNGDGTSVSQAAKHLSVSWPFYNWSSSSGWTDYTTGVSTHVGADKYSHDLSKSNCEGIGIYAGMAGQVVQAIPPTSWNGGYGGTVVVYDWNRHVAIRYSHMKYINVTRGQWVSFRQYLGLLGHTGNATGPHLHITAYENIDHFSGGYPVIPTSHDSEHYFCMIDWIF